MLNIKSFLRAIGIVPTSSSAISAKGEMEVLSSSGRLNYHNGSSASPVVTESHADQGANRLQNKDLEDSTTAIVDASDTTKKLKFDAAGTTGTSTTITGSQTSNRTQTLQDVTDTFVYRTSTDTLTNKTIAAGSNTITGLTNTNLSGSAAITNANLATMSNNTIKGNVSGISAVPTDLTGTQATTILVPFVGDSGSGGTKGLVPAPAAGDTAASKFLKADGTWTTPAGSGTVTSVAMTVPAFLSVAGSPVTTTGTLAVSLSGTALPTANGGTGLTSSGTSGNVLTSNGSVWVSSAPVTTSEYYAIYNAGLAASVAANALTIAIKQSDGTTNPSSGTAAVTIGQRNSSLTTGGYNLRTITSATSVVVPNGATLGLTSGQSQYVYVYIIDNAGTQEVAVSGFPAFTDNTIVSTTLIDNTSTDQFTLYSTTARTNVPVRYYGKIKSAQATAGTWATSPTEIDLRTGTPDSTWTRMGSLIVNNFGTLGISKLIGRREGDSLHVRGFFVTGTPASAQASIELPSSITFNSPVDDNSSTPLGVYYNIAGSANIYPGSGATGIMVSAGSSTNKVAFAFSYSSGFTLQNGDGIAPPASNMCIEFIAPITEWSL